MPAGASNFGTLVYDDDAYMRGSKASITVPSGQAPDNNQAVAHRVGNEQNGSSHAIQAGIYRTTNLRVSCGTSENGWHKYSEQYENGIYACHEYGSATAGNEVDFSVSRTDVDGQWRVKILGAVKDTYDLGYGQGYSYMGSEINSETASTSGAVDIRYCDDVSWKVFDGTFESSPVTVTSNSQWFAASGAGWTFGNFPCGVRFQH